MKTVKLNSFKKTDLTDKYLFLKIVDTDNGGTIASTEKYPSDQTLPVTYGINPHPQFNLYKSDHVCIQLWGDSTGLLASSVIHMAKYKIQFPIDMETGEDGVSFSVAGTWD